MPIYAFACTACGHHFDRLQRLSDPDPEVCPQCDAAAVKRQLTSPSFRLSGSGWYETDFKKDGDKKRNLTEKGEAATGADTAPTTAPAVSKPEPKADTSTETKPATKPEPAAKPKPSGPEP